MSETPEQKATRRRWINLAELVAVAGVLIGAMTLWLNWSDRREDKALASAASATAARERYRFELKGKVDGDEVLLLRDEDHALGDVRVAFPTALGVPPRDAVAHTIDKDWFAKPLLKLTDGGADDRTGRLPVLVTYGYTVGDRQLQTSAIYDLIWRTEGRFLQGRSLKLTEFRLRRAGGDQAALEAAWSKVKP